MCFALDWWFSGVVITQHKTLTLLAISFAFKLSPIVCRLKHGKIVILCDSCYPVFAFLYFIIPYQTILVLVIALWVFCYASYLYESTLLDYAMLHLQLPFVLCPFLRMSGHVHGYHHLVQNLQYPYKIFNGLNDIIEDNSGENEYRCFFFLWICSVNNRMPFGMYILTL